MFILVYGADGTGKSVQCKSIAESMSNPEHWSFAVKNRKLYEKSSVPSIELLKFNANASINPYQTIDAFHDRIASVTRQNLVDCIIIDEITLLRSWAQPVVIEEINKTRRAYQKPPITKIGENNLAGWARVNQIVYGELERLVNWSVINDVMVVAITSITEKRRAVTGDDGETKTIPTGEFVVDAKENIRKLADVRVKLERDGKNGKGFYAIFEKCQDWMTEGNDSVKVDKTGLLNELMMRGCIG